MVARRYLLADLGDALRLRAGAIERAQRGQPAHDVEEVIREERQRLPALARARSVYRPTSHMKTGTSGSVSSITPAARRSIEATSASDRDRDDRGEHGLRDVPRERRLERVHAGHGRGRDLRALRAVERGRLPSESRLDDVEAELRDDLTGRPPPGDLEAPDGQRARRRRRRAARAVS